MITNFLTRLYCGMVSRMYRGAGTETTQTTKKTKPHWEEKGGEPEEELQQLLSDIRTRVSTLKTVVQEQSREIESTLDDTEKIVASLPEAQQLALDIDNLTKKMDEK